MGTLEPRKAYPLALQACTRWWQEGADRNLVIVGREGWKDLSADLRRDIPETAAAPHGDPEFGRRLFWPEGISDEDLEAVYQASTALLAASRGEGLGLPLIEAAQRGLPLICRDLAAIREVAADHTYYFQRYRRRTASRLVALARSLSRRPASSVRWAVLAGLAGIGAPTAENRAAAGASSYPLAGSRNHVIPQSSKWCNAPS